MIQRIQSIFLLLVFILMALTAFSPLLMLADASGTLFSFTSLAILVKNTQLHTWGVVSMAGLSALTALINIFFYNKRKAQIKLGWVTTILIILFYVTVFVYFSSYASKFGFTISSVQYGIILPVIALIFNILAIQRIKKDEKLVRSLDRIR
ncbi:MAG: DUF4293 domain-containing protein [Dysgonomonas sp.]|nr:DUF4293 domain-containing protein [Dysgonomonas sp.]